MKIIQSYWSKPFELRSKDGGLLNSGGWCAPVFYYMSHALSCLSLSKFYKNVELYTDAEGYDLLIKKLHLPYSNVHIVLDNLRDYPTSAWAVGKIYTYSLQTSPFIHVDNDVYIWKRFTDYIEEAQLLAQHNEHNYTFNRAIILDVISKVSYLPDAIKKSKGFYDEANAGIIGGKDIDFLLRYSNEALKFLDRNIKCLCQFKYPNFFNTIFEQYLFSCLARCEQKDVMFAFQNVDNRFNEVCRFDMVPNKQYYIHALAFYKKMFKVGECIAYHLWYHFPKYYTLIISLHNKKQL